MLNYSILLTLNWLLKCLRLVAMNAIVFYSPYWQWIGSCSAWDGLQWMPLCSIHLIDNELAPAAPEMGCNECHCVLFTLLTMNWLLQRLRWVAMCAIMFYSPYWQWIGSFSAWNGLQWMPLCSIHLIDNELAPAAPELDGGAVDVDVLVDFEFLHHHEYPSRQATRGHPVTDNGKFTTVPQSDNFISIFWGLQSMKVVQEEQQRGKNTAWSTRDTSSWGTTEGPKHCPEALSTPHHD